MGDDGARNEALPIFLFSNNDAEIRSERRGEGELFGIVRCRRDGPVTIVMMLLLDL
jgi:hypothetical protein